jgi:hypothetical protein
MGSEWISRRLAWGCGLDSTGSGQGPVAVCCECGDEPSSSFAAELVSEVTRRIRCTACQGNSLVDRHL